MRFYKILYGTLLFLSSLIIWLILCHSLFKQSDYYLLYGTAYIAEIISYFLMRYKQIYERYIKILFVLAVINLAIYLITLNVTYFYYLNIFLLTSVKSFLVISRIKDINYLFNTLDNKYVVEKQYKSFHAAINLSAIGVPLMVLLYNVKYINYYLRYSYIGFSIILGIYIFLYKEHITQYRSMSISWKDLVLNYKVFLFIILSIHIMFPYIIRTILSTVREYNVYIIISNIIGTALIYYGSVKINNKNYIKILFTFILLFLLINSRYFAAYYQYAEKILLLFILVVMLVENYFLEWYITSWKEKAGDKNLEKDELGTIKLFQLFIGLGLTLVYYFLLEYMKIKIIYIGYLVIIFLTIYTAYYFINYKKMKLNQLLFK